MNRRKHLYQENSTVITSLYIKFLNYTVSLNIHRKNLSILENILIRYLFKTKQFNCLSYLSANLLNLVFIQRLLLKGQ